MDQIAQAKLSLEATKLFQQFCSVDYSSKTIEHGIEVARRNGDTAKLAEAEATKRSLVQSREELRAAFRKESGGFDPSQVT